MTLPPVAIISRKHSSAVAVWQTKLDSERSAKAESVLHSSALQIIESAHDLFAKPLAPWRIMRSVAASQPRKRHAASAADFE
jgi:hypothetical protein